MIDEQRLLRRFRELVLIDSPALKEAPCVARVRAELEGMGLEVREDDAGAKLGGNGNNLIAWKRGTLKDAPKIFLSAHMDTVEPTPNLQLTRNRRRHPDRRQRPSSAPTARAASRPPSRPSRPSSTPARTTATSASSSPSPRRSASKAQTPSTSTGLDLDYGFVLDTGPPVGTYVTRTATHDKLDIVIKGRPAHAGKDPENGLNALQVAADAIHGMRLGRIGPETTANLGKIEGGTATNVVMAEVTIHAEARSTNVAELEAQVAHMTERFEEAAEAWGAEIEIRHLRHYASYHVPDDAPVVRVAQRASRALGFEPTLRTTLGGSDANVYNAKGLPSIVVATGMDKIHTHEEFIRVKDLVDTARLALELIRQAAKETRA